jgi:peptidoglycan LD-endopeptidase CwlK
MKKRANIDSRNINDLDKEFKQKIEILLETCNKKGYVFVPFSTLRGPEMQAKLYCSGRTDTELRRLVRRLENQKAKNISKLINSNIVSRSANRKTNALPGQSWHQHGLAVDCFLQINQKADWNNLKAYRVYGEEAKKLGLYWGGDFKKLKDLVHVQLPRESSPEMSLQEIDSFLAHNFS